MAFDPADRPAMKAVVERLNTIRDVTVRCARAARH
jgi:hypothetical protein